MTDVLDGQGMVVVDDDDEFLNEAKRLFDGRVPTLGSLADAKRSVEETEVDVVILGPSHAHEEALKEAGSLLDLDAELGVVLVANSITAPLLKAALRAGLTDVIEAPLSVEKLTEAISQVDRVNRRRSGEALPPEPFAPEPTQGTVITVMSAKGGSGKTVFATNVAMLLAKNSKPGEVVMVRRRPAVRRCVPRVATRAEIYSCQRGT